MQRRGRLSSRILKKMIRVREGDKE
jgi:translation initiation factor IF-1